jgi:hypothetical protein
MRLAIGARRASQDAPPTRQASRTGRARMLACTSLLACLLVPCSALGASAAPARSLRGWREPPAPSLGAAFAALADNDALVQQGPKLLGEGETGQGLFGASVALSADGNTAIVGAPLDDNDVGGVWVFTRTGSTWTQQGEELTGAEEAGRGEFGSSVAISADGHTAVIGGREDDHGTGAAWVFTRTGSSWSQQGAKLTGAEEDGDGAYGTSVALSGDGQTALVGGEADDGGVGAAWILTRSGSTWSQQGAKLTGTEDSGASGFGSSVALSADDSTALIGGQDDDGGVGAAWIFTRSGSTWSQQGAKLTGAGESGAGAFGWSAALSASGATALIGGEADDGDLGAAWVFTRSGSTWTQQGPKLVGNTGSDKAFFGSGVALSASGNIALVGGHDYDDIGATWEFTRSRSRWRLREAPLSGGEEAGFGAFGSSVALSSDGETALIGGQGDEEFVGAAWVFVDDPAPIVKQLTPRAGPCAGGTAVTITGANLLGATAVYFGSISATSFTVNSATSITAFAPSEPSGRVAVTVTTSEGTSRAVSSKVEYRFRRARR